MTVNILYFYRTEVWSVGKPRLWGGVRSLVLRQLSNLVHAWCTGK